MSSFRFPPPPPPPPKASSNDTQDTYGSQREGRGGRGYLGHRRGDQERGRGRGNYQNNSRDGLGQGNLHIRGGPREDSQQQHSARGSRHNQNHAHDVFQQPPAIYSPSPFKTSSNLPSPYGMPPFANPAMGSLPAPQVDPVVFASFLATPAGMHSMTAFANHMASTSTATQVPQQSHPSGQGACKKRRQERGMQYEAEQKSQQYQNGQQQTTKPPRAKAKAAPPVPSFGFALPIAPKLQHAATKKSDVRRDPKRRKLNLGLTQQVEEDPASSSEEEIDEEAVWAPNAKLKNGVVFEHEGEAISLQTEADVAAWLKERRTKFPTQQRIAEKAQEAAGKRESELKFLARITGRPREQKAQNEQVLASNSRFKQQQHDPTGSRMKNQERMKKAKPDVQGNDSPTATTKPPAINLDLGYSTETEAEEDNSMLSDSSVLSDTSESSEESGSDPDDSDAPPTPQTSKVAIALAGPTPPLSGPAVQPQKRKVNSVCLQWKERGKCKYGRHCKHPHPSKDDPPRMMGLYERMVEQELEKADRLALDAIKFLGRNGFLG